MAINKSKFKKSALLLSLCLLLVWAMLGTGASIAWFNDSSPDVKNVFHFAEFDLSVSHRLSDGTYEEVNSQTKIFNDEALYEPGYVQVVYLRVNNNGSVPFNFQTAVNVTDYTTATNAFGKIFHLQDYLKFGLVTADTEAEMMEKVKTREKAVQIANEELNHYSTDMAELGSGKAKYIALVVRMPEMVRNDANYRGTPIPKVELGLIVKATQK